MKPFGLEGKVGAPAIVRTNPLCALLDRHAATLRRLDPSSDWLNDLHYSLKDQLGIVFASSPAPSWHDALEALQRSYDAERHPLMRILQETYLYQVSLRVTDPVLVYDLDTPKLQVSIGREWPTTRVAVLRGTCGHLRLGADVHGIIEGLSRELSFSTGVILRGGMVNLIYPCSNALCAIADARTGDIPFARIDLHSAVFLSKTPLRYSGMRGAVCDPTEDRRLKGIYDRMRSYSTDPELFLEQVPLLCATSDALFPTAKQLHLNRNDPYEAGSSMIQQFTPRGVSR